MSQTSQAHVHSRGHTVWTYVEIKTSDTQFLKKLSSCDFVQVQQQEPRHTMARVSTNDCDEIDYEEMPDFVHDTSEVSLKSQVFTLEFLSRSDYSRAPSRPFKEDSIADSSQTILTIHKYQ
jgi:hypothetical protein